jgi:hypothetical protein
MSQETGRREVYVQSFQDRRIRVQVTTDGGYEPRWSNDEKKLFFASEAGEILNRVPITLRDRPAVGTAIPLFRIDASSGVDGSNHYQVAPDGRILINGSQVSRGDMEISVTLNWPSLLNPNR